MHPNKSSKYTHLSLNSRSTHIDRFHLNLALFACFLCTQKQCESSDRYSWHGCWSFTKQMHYLLRCQIVHGGRSVWWKHSSSSSSHSILSSNCASHYCPSLNCLSAIIHLCLPHLHLLLICTCVTDRRHELTQRRFLRQTARTVACISECCVVSDNISVDPWCTDKVQKEKHKNWRIFMLIFLSWSTNQSSPNRYHCGCGG